MTILFLHGWRSIPDGLKHSYLAQHGHEVINSTLHDDDFEEALRVAQAEYDKHHPDGADDTVPFADSVELVRNSGLAASALIEADTDHRLADPEPLEGMVKACERAAKAERRRRANCAGNRAADSCADGLMPTWSPSI